MPRDFNSFINENKVKIDATNEKVEEYKNIIDKYKDMNSSDLMSNLMSEASKLKKEGKLDSNMLEGLKDTLTPFLSDEQKNTLESLISTINQQK